MMPCCFFLRPILESVYQIQTNNSYRLCFDEKNILAVDDEPDMTTLLKMALERAGFGIDIFNDPLLPLESFNQTCKGYICPDPNPFKIEYGLLGLLEHILLN
jgi:hypothetical protein